QANGDLPFLCQFLGPSLRRVESSRFGVPVKPAPLRPVTGLERRGNEPEADRDLQQCRRGGDFGWVLHSVSIVLSCLNVRSMICERRLPSTVNAPGLGAC